MKVEGFDREYVLTEAVRLYMLASGNTVQLQAEPERLRNAIYALNTVMAALPPEIPADLGEQLRRAFESGMQPEGPKPVP